MKKSDLERIKKIIRIWESVQAQIAEKQITEEKLLHDEFMQWALTTPLYNIGEHVYNLSPELKRAWPDVPWSVVAGLRHRLVHDYDGINWNIIAGVIFEDMASFIEQLRLIEPLLKDT